MSHSVTSSLLAATRRANDNLPAARPAGMRPESAQSRLSMHENTVPWYYHLIILAERTGRRRAPADIVGRSQHCGRPAPWQAIRE